MDIGGEGASVGPAGGEGASTGPVGGDGASTGPAGGGGVGESSTRSRETDIESRRSIIAIQVGYVCINY
jgi:hypothetical protein